MDPAVAVVIRKSTRDDLKVSLSKQVAMGQEWAEKNRPGQPVTVFSDEATSGVRMDRPGWVAFREAVEAGRISHVWAYEQSRLTRAGAATWDDVCELLWGAGIREVHTHRQGIISVAEGDRLHGAFNSVMDKHEREVVKVRTRDQLRANAHEGRPHGYPGFGYSRAIGEDGRPAFVPNPGQAEVVQWMVEQVAAGSSLGLVARTLIERRVPTTRGGAWTAASVRAIVTAPRIVGLRTHHGRVVGEATWPAIVDRDVWEQAQSRLAYNRPGHTADQRRRYLLTGGLAVCDSCDTPLISVRANGEPAYGCPHPSRPDGGCGHCSIVARRLEPYVLDAVARWLEDPMFVEEMNRHLAAEAADAAPIRAELAEVEAKLAHLAEQWATGNVLDFENTAARRSLLARRGELTDRLAALPVVPVLRVEDLLDAWAGAVEVDDVATLRAVVAALAAPIRVRSAFDGGRRLSVRDRVAVRPSW